MSNNDPFADLIRSLEENLQQEGGGRDRPPVGGQREQAGGGSRRLLWYLIPILILVFFNRLVGLFADFTWYGSLDLTSVFATRIFATMGLFFAGALLFWLFLAVNVLLARRLEPRGLADTPLEQIAAMFGLRVTPVILGLGVVVAFFMGVGASSVWEQVLLFFNQTDFAQTDPIFGRDVAFFVFTLPVWQAARTWLMFALVITLISTAAASGIGWRGWQVSTPVLAHLSILGALILLLIAWQYRLDAYQLVYSQRGAVFGAGYADERAQLPAYNILSVVTLITAVLLIVTAFLRRAWRAIVVVLLIWIAAAFLGGNVYPGLVQRFQVNPNELTLERPYIENNIEFTRAAFDLADIEVRDYDATTRLVAADLVNESDTVRNVRLWDYRPLLQTYNQVQALRQYYAFNDIDIDRYVIDGQLRQVMLAARELVPDRLDVDAQTWVNQKLVYTHGYGVAASPVSQVTPDGLPEFFLKDLPPQGIVEITRPQIYFGELTNSYVIARTDEPEFDYPSGEGNVTTHFDADTGIEMTLGRRLLFALRFADINILLNSDITAQSQLLWRRNIVERIQEVAPFLRYDEDPYIVVGTDGGLYWFLDAYTVSNRYPYSEPWGSINYIRNSVKVVTNAYDGTMHFYVVDPAEPIIAAYSQIFPDLFTPIAEMPEDLTHHVRYPNTLFRVQAEVYMMYHMTDPIEFYNREDMWAWPEEIFDTEAERMEPYYVLMQLPGDDNLRFVTILPFTPANRENMIAWLAADSDVAQYGKKLVFEFGKDALVFGPKQVEARIDQNPEISAQLSLWNQQGSNVIRGNLLVIPVAGSLIYVEPLYLQAASGRIPELKRVILATADRVTMQENLGLAFLDLFGDEILAAEGVAELATFGGEVPEAVELIESGATVEGSVAPSDLTLPELVTRANEHFARAEELVRDGNWAGYGAEISALQSTLAQLAELVGADVTESASEEQAPDGEPLEPATEPEPSAGS